MLSHNKTSVRLNLFLCSKHKNVHISLKRLTNESLKAVGHCVPQVRFPAQVRPVSIKHEAIQLQFLKEDSVLQVFIIRTVSHPS